MTFIALGSFDYNLPFCRFIGKYNPHIKENEGDAGLINSIVMRLMIHW